MDVTSNRISLTAWGRLYGFDKATTSRLHLTGRLPPELQSERAAACSGDGPMISTYQTRVTVFRGKDRAEGEAALAAYAELYWLGCSGSCSPTLPLEIQLTR